MMLRAENFIELNSMRTVKEFIDTINLMQMEIKFTENGKMLMIRVTSMLLSLVMSALSLLTTVRVINSTNLNTMRMAKEFIDITSMMLMEIKLKVNVLMLEPMIGVHSMLP